MTDNIDNLLDAALNKDKLAVQERLDTVERKKQEAEQEKLQDRLVLFIRSGDIENAAEVLEEGADIKSLKIDDIPYTGIKEVKFVISKLDMTDAKQKEFAQALFDRQCYVTEKNLPEIIEVSKNNDLSLDEVLCYVSHFDQDDRDKVLGMYKKLVEAGADKQAFDFDHLANVLSKKMHSSAMTEDPEWVKPGVNVLEELMVAVIKDGYKINKENPDVDYFLSYLAYKREYENFSEQDKKLIEDMKSNNIEEVRKALEGGNLPHKVESYMEYVEPGNRFFNYYKGIMGKMYIGPKKFTEVEASKLEDKDIFEVVRAVADYKVPNYKELLAKKVESVSFRKAVSAVRDHDILNVEELVADKFLRICKDIISHANGSCSEYLDILREGSAKCKRAAVDKVIPYLVEELENSDKSIMSDNRVKPTDKALNLAVEIYSDKLSDGEELSVLDDKGKNKLRMALLKFRTSGDNEFRRFKAKMFSRAAKFYVPDDKMDDMLKAAREVSYTPNSPLNKLLKEIQKEKVKE